MNKLDKLDRAELLYNLLYDVAGSRVYDVADYLLYLARNEPERLAEALGLDLRVTTPEKVSEPLESISGHVRSTIESGIFEPFDKKIHKREYDPGDYRNSTHHRQVITSYGPWYPIERGERGSARQ